MNALDKEETKQISDDVRRAFIKAKKDNYYTKKISKKNIIISIILIIVIFSICLIVFYRQSPSKKYKESLKMLNSYIRANSNKGVVISNRYYFYNGSFFIKEDKGLIEIGDYDLLIDSLEKDFQRALADQKIKYTKTDIGSGPINKISISIDDTNRNNIFNNLESAMESDSDLRSYIENNLKVNSKDFIEKFIVQKKKQMYNVTIDLLYSRNYYDIRVNNDSILQEGKANNSIKYTNINDLTTF